MGSAPDPSAMPGRLPQGGFSLLEVLVAFAILALTLGVLLQVFAGGARSSRTSGDYARAAELAESVLARVGTGIPLAAGVQQGEEQGYLWTLEMTPYQPTDMLAPPEHAALLHLVVRVQWSEREDDGHGLRLDSLRVVEPGA